MFPTRAYDLCSHESMYTFHTSLSEDYIISKRMLDWSPALYPEEWGFFKFVFVIVYIVVVVDYGGGGMCIHGFYQIWCNFQKK